MSTHDRNLLIRIFSEKHRNFSENKHHFTLIALIFMLCPCFSRGQNTVIIPQPESCIAQSGRFLLDSTVIIGMNDNSLLPQANYLQKNLEKADGIRLAVSQDEAKANIDFRLTELAGRADTPGAYHLDVTPQKIIISASDNSGIFYGIISLLQLVDSKPAGKAILIAACRIADAPRYQWRGFMLDESRHFFGKEKVKQLLDWMAFYKLNRFHWHLTDDDGWRIGIKKYPALTAIGAIGNHTDTLAPALFYTQDEIRDIVDYAHDRFITVIPEIDMPGHATAANKAYPEFSGGSIHGYENYTFDPGNEKTYGYLSGILKEVNSLFPSHLVHLGGDEVALGMQAWAGRPTITRLVEQNQFGSLEDVEHYFFARMADTAVRMGNKVLCWDESASANLPPSRTIVLWWRQNFPSQLELAMNKKYDIVLCPRLPLYFDFVQDRSHISGRRWNGRFFNSLSDVYRFPDLQMPAAALQSKLILGIQANLWTETVKSGKRLDFMIFPRIAALAESAWTLPSQKNETSFNERLRAEFPLFDRNGIYYYNPFQPASHPEAVDFLPHIKKHYRHIKTRRHRRKSAHLKKHNIKKLHRMHGK